MPESRREKSPEPDTARIVLFGDHLTEDQHRLWKMLGGTLTRQFVRRGGQVSWVRLSYQYDRATLEVLLATHLRPTIDDQPSPPAILWADYCARQPALAALGDRILTGNHGAAVLAERLLALLLQREHRKLIRQ